MIQSALNFTGRSFKLQIMSQLALVYESAQKQSIQSIPIPEPPAGYIQVRIEAAAINPLDQKIYDFAHRFIQKCPTVLGVDAAGEVTKIGPGVTKFNVGDRVVFTCTPNSPEGVDSGHRGAFQQFALADVRITAKIPASIDYDSASSFPVAGNTAAGALYGQLKFMEPWLGGEGAYTGQKIVILGGSSSVGSYAIQLAALGGLEVVTTSSPAHFDHLKSLGATTVIDRSAPDVAAQILVAAGGPAKYVVDCISLLPTQLLGVEILEPQGKLVLVLSAQPPTTAAAEAKGVTLLGTSGPSGAYVSEPFWDSLEKYFERGVVKFNKPTVLRGGLHAWDKGFELHRQGKVSGTKIVIRRQETKV
ncbi:chaperonin 10-like protein [Mycena olivaceomarginata]|nr:chaperonin 10-like protein [Mycena olivaceomarginata]